MPAQAGRGRAGSIFCRAAPKPQVDARIGNVQQIFTGGDTDGGRRVAWENFDVAWHGPLSSAGGRKTGFHPLALRKYPITVFLDQKLETPRRATDWQPTHSRLLVHCTHPSVTRHPFVQELSEDRTTGSICTEDTFDRTVSLHNSFEHFDPVACLVDEMRAAASGY